MGYEDSTRVGQAGIGKEKKRLLEVRRREAMEGANQQERLAKEQSYRHTSPVRQELGTKLCCICPHRGHSHSGPSPAEASHPPKARDLEVVTEPPL